MVKVVTREGGFSGLKKAAKTPQFKTFIVFLFLLIALPVTFFVLSKQQDIRQRAAGETATIKAVPSSGTFTVGIPTTVDVVVDGGGQEFNAAQATITVSSNLQVNNVTITPQSEGGCNFTFVNAGSTPTAVDPSFVGAILNSSSAQCTVYSLTVLPTAVGAATITIAGGSVKSYTDSSEIFASAESGSYTVQENATPTPTSVVPSSSALLLSPATGSVNQGENLVVDVRVNTNGQTVNATEVILTYPLSLFDVIEVDTSASAFDILAEKTVSNGIINVAAGTITPKSGNLLIARLTLQAKTGGTGSVSFASGSMVISDVSNENVVSSFTNGVYTVFAPVPTSTPTTIMTPTVTPTTANTPTPLPTGVPTPLPVQVPTVNAIVSPTYANTITLAGTKAANVTEVLVNGSASGTTYPTSTSWERVLNLSLGANTITIAGRNAGGSTSTTTSVTVTVHKVGDINGDTLVDLADLSMFGSDWEKTGNLNFALSDMNSDGVINLTDFSIIARAYGN